MQLWDVPSHQLVGAPLPGPGDAVLDLAFAPTGAKLHVAGAHTEARVHDLGAETVVRALCRRVPAPLTRAEWAALVPDAPYSGDWNIAHQEADLKNWKA
ncbi:hypothetical protein, partial [Streptomyces sp. NPDC006307]|uniref:hypothetical protein n=1 Tax=Streptomyces sp. NPDC006307 TaxID=3156748 RepID=UPI00339E9B5D